MFEIKIGKLFDILSCKCKMFMCKDFSGCEGCQDSAHIECDCEADQKIPEVECLYVIDQRSRTNGCKGKFQMTGKDRKA